MFNFEAIDEYWGSIKLPDESIFIPKYQELVTIITAALEISVEKMAEATDRDNSNPKCFKKVSFLTSILVREYMIIKNVFP